MLEALLERYRRHDRLALARLLSLASRGEHLAAILQAVATPSRSARVIAFTGNSGVGKSTLIGQLIPRLRQQGLTLAVLACDPQSPLSGGALLGDRLRMPSEPDAGMFIRSLAAVAGHGAVAERLDVMIRLCEAFGFDLILIETVGAGQGDTAVRDLADVVVLLLQPESGDDLQWNKAGVLEVADIVVIHKADLPGAQQTAAAVKEALELSPRPIACYCVSSRTGADLDDLAKALLTWPLRRDQHVLARRLLLQLAQEAVARRFAAAEAIQDPELARLLADFQRGILDDETSGDALLSLLTQKTNTMLPQTRTDQRSRP